MCNESVERSTERHHSSITTADVKRNTAREQLEADYMRALRLLLVGVDEAVHTPAFYTKTMSVAEASAEGVDGLPDDGRETVSELLAVAVACADGRPEARHLAQTLIDRLLAEHVSTHLDAAAEE